MSIGASQTKVSCQTKYMACLLDQQNELQVWDVQGKSKCLTRLKPADILTNEKTVGRFTCIDFTASEVSIGNLI